MCFLKLWIPITILTIHFSYTIPCPILQSMLKFQFLLSFWLSSTQPTLIIFPPIVIDYQLWSRLKKNRPNSEQRLVRVLLIILGDMVGLQYCILLSIFCISSNMQWINILIVYSVGLTILLQLWMPHCFVVVWECIDLLDD